MIDVIRRDRIERLRVLRQDRGDTTCSDIAWSIHEIENADALLSARVALARTEIVTEDLVDKIRKAKKRLDKLEGYRQRTEGDARLLRGKIETLEGGR